MSDESSLHARVGQLKSEGKYEAAADALELAGDLEEAAKTLAEVWQYDKAVEVACRGNHFALAYEIATLGNQVSLSQRLIQELRDWPEQAKRAAVFAEQRGRQGDAATLWVQMGDPLRAAPLFGDAGECIQGARCYEAVGNYREAGRLYERRLREAPEDGEAALRLGSILASFGRHKAAVGALQKAAGDSEFEADALRLMVWCFSEMGMVDAARDCFVRYRRFEPDITESLDGFLTANFAAGHAGGSANQEREKTFLAGRYRIERRLGEGGSGKVLLAHDEFYNRDVAIKVLTVGDSKAGRDAYLRFEREARIATALEHPQIVRVFEYNPSGPFLVMEYMRGGTLQDRIDEAGRAPLDAELVRSVAEAVLSGLDAVHRRGVVHRDLKPANVFFDEAGRVKIGDFGTAHLNDLGSTLTGAMLGTLAYMSPEQVTANLKPVAATDFYTFGVMLFQMLTGRLPFEGPDFVQQHREEPPPKPSTFNSSFLGAADDLLGRLLAKDVMQRPRSTAEIRRLLADVDWSYEAVTLDDTVSAPLEPSGVLPAFPVSEERWRVITSAAHGVYQMAEDTILKRPVWMRKTQGDSLDWLTAFARADGPFLQAVFGVEGEHLLIEAPRGVPLEEAQDIDLTKAEVQLRAALTRIHRAGLVHGAVDSSHVRVGAGRVILMLPDKPAEGAAQDDLAALEQVLQVIEMNP